MSALPIIERELRVRARRRSTVWLRVIVGLVAGLSAVVTLSWAQQFRGASLPGKALFDSLNGLVFAFCLFEGVRQTADCLSQEKREGTIGLLFLTELRSIDVVLGKFVAASLDSFYGLLAVFPIMGVTLLAGGVTAGEFWRTPLVLLNTLFLALACGLWVSARQREQGRALLIGFALVFAITLLPLPLELLLALTGIPSFSPGVAMQLANDASYSATPGRFWLSLLAVHTLGWTLLVLSARKLAASRRDDPVLAVSLATVALAAPVDNPAEPPAHTESLRLLRDADPAAWLARRQRVSRVFVWIAIVLLLFGGVGLVSLLNLVRASGGSWVFTTLHWTTQLLPLLLLAFVSAQGLGEARRGGALELLLCTPVSPEEIVRGQWAAIWEQLQRPIIVVGWIVVGLAVCRVVFDPGLSQYIWFPLLQFLQGILCLVRALAVCRVAMYLGLRARTTWIAVGQTMIYAMAVPIVAGMVIWLILSTLIIWPVTGPMPRWYLLHQAVDMVLSLAYSLALIHWSRHRLLTRFREIAAAN